MKIINYIKNNYKKLWFSFAINLILVFLIILLFVPIFDTNDDIAIRSFVTGEYGFYDYHIVFSNVILGWVLASLYQMINFIPWYELMHYLFIYLSLSFLTHIILNKGKSLLLLLTILLLFSIDLYVKLQFTKTASVLSISGGLILINNALNDEEHKIMYLFGILLIVLGFMVRPKQCLACLGIEAAFCIPFYKTLFTKKNILVCLIIMILCGLCYFVDKKSYSSKEYQEYLTFNYLRSELLDRGFPDYSVNWGKFHDMELTENAYWLYWTWDFNDPDKFTIPVMQEIVDLKQNEEINIKNNILYIFKYMFNKIYYAILILLVISMIIRKNGFSTSMLMCFLSFICLCYFALLMKPDLEDRVIYPLLFEMFILLFYSYNPIDFIRKKNYICSFWISFITIVLIFFAIFNIYGTQSRFIYNDKKINEKYLESINKNDVYIVSTPCNLISNKLFDQVDFGVYSNKIMLGGWQTHHPLFLQVANLNNVSNPFDDLINRDDVYLISNDKRLDLIIKYIEDYYFSNVDYDVIKKIENDVCIYKLEKDIEY